MNAVFTGKTFGFAPPGARRHRATDAAPELQIVRLAADGAWLSFVTTGHTRINADLRAVHDGLIEQTYRRA
ncbi:hypothetical protein [Bradyrhizobium sp. Gha]|uniref:hypothetical protein n=1 Tax=Bradyrhizobium sp. Gha TaxID=1855318 RepID=UPI0008EE05DB|nr:hypothetical protein [Bradyrhizobium sp. Gha]SFI53867.1 hypothetical protein SAMN05216525_11059 [Bradyrhizobium sp. Gha]